MLYLLLLTTVVVATAVDAEKAQTEPKQAETAQPIRVYDGEHRYRFKDGLELIRSRDDRNRQQDSRHRMHDDHHRDEYHDSRQGPYKHDNNEHYDHIGPQILRSPEPLHSNGHPDIERQNKIIADVFSPDYAQPTWTLDYRYMKTGGRDYTRGPGGQILILPKNIRTNEHKEFTDFDSLLEHLRLSRLSERAKHSGHVLVDEHDVRRGYQHIDLGQYGRGQNLQQNWWKSNRNQYNHRNV